MISMFFVCLMINEFLFFMFSSFGGNICFLFEGPFWKEVTVLQIRKVSFKDSFKGHPFGPRYMCLSWFGYFLV